MVFRERETNTAERQRGASLERDDAWFEKLDTLCLIKKQRADQVVLVRRPSLPAARGTLPRSVCGR
ncbi:MAG: hypothetical protein A2848_00895 [Candidatus Magasanikbacteria bacterium RIFCSPHIGHO2_01_FULL_50_8]|uniref:Uncharacterized protein n=2 Tax=Candidatus Magasanikiibacteriota TaxID=1752731 RepID=A0A1F6LUG6_9BACT|nr:MAG: hypothetical protein A2848_00895 [Candidatus Magasanikbacteria bacterium RIFCSPHIGHO2_01_FULL_50_8]OGH68185.1 MAG: hypothetical protein A3C15_01005 [Candidatus Magasanikbacteria bacterium RIFCSPHIGHO2_02_FULL_50_9b]